MVVMDDVMVRNVWNDVQICAFSAAIAAGMSFDDAIVSTGQEVTPDSTSYGLSLINSPQFQNTVNTLVANNILSTGMALCWRVVRETLTSDNYGNSRINAATWVRETLKDMHAGKLGSSTDSLADLSKEELQVILADAKQRSKKLAKQVAPRS